MSVTISVQRASTATLTVDGEIRVPSVAENVTPPALGVTPVVGAALDYTAGVWTYETAVSVQAQRSLDSVTFANVGAAWDSIVGTPYTVVSGDASYQFRVIETATPGDVTATSNTTNAPVINTVAPALSAAPVVGTQLGYTAGTWSGATSVSVQAQRRLAAGAWANVGSAWDSVLGTPYTPVDGDFGYTFQVVETATPGAVTANSNETGQTTITGIALWLDASDASTLFQDSAGTVPATADGSVVGRWADKSSAGNHATQTTTASKPLLKLAIKNGRPVLRFDSVDDVLTVAGPTYGAAATWFIVTTPSNTTERYVFGGAGNTIAIISKYAGKNYEWFNTAADRYTLSVAATGFNVLSVSQVDGGALTGRINATAAFSATATVTIATKQLLAVGSQPAPLLGFGGDIAEFLIFNTALSAGAVSAVEAYLMTNWGI